MIGLDTNVLVRYLTQDDAAQARKADAVINDAVARRERCVIGPVVLCELVWVLREAYDTPKDQLLTTLERILATQQFEIVEKDRMREAFEAFRTGRADFADCVIGHYQSSRRLRRNRHLRSAATRDGRVSSAVMREDRR